jgi:hypothetical protein
MIQKTGESLRGPHRSPSETVGKGYIGPLSDGREGPMEGPMTS